jgi:hypothetical protein
MDTPNRFELVHAYLYAYDSDHPHTIKVVAEAGTTYELRIYALYYSFESSDWQGFEGRVVACDGHPKAEFIYHLREDAWGVIDTKWRQGWMNVIKG